MNKVNVQTIEDAREHLRGVVRETALQFHPALSKKYGAKIFLKREDRQVVRSYKIRGAYNRMRQLKAAEKKRGIVCASAGNHAQGVALSCAELKVKGTIFMPRNTPRQKIDRVNTLGGNFVTIELIGDTFDEAYGAAVALAAKTKKVFVHPFNDPGVIAGQGTIAAEVMEQLEAVPECVVVPIGGGGCISGIGTYFKAKSPRTKVFGVEPEGAPGMYKSFKKGKVVTLEKVDTFVDGAAVRTVGQLSFSIARKVTDKIVLVPEGKVGEARIELYQRDGIVAEPAGALSVAALDALAKDIKGKTVVCIVSGGNNDISRYPEVIERSLVYKGLKHYFIINFSQRPGALRSFLDDALGPTDDITLFEYVKKNNRENGPALIGVELAKKEDLKPLLKRMRDIGFSFELLEKDSPMFRFIV